MKASRCLMRVICMLSLACCCFGGLLVEVQIALDYSDNWRAESRLGFSHATRFCRSLRHSIQAKWTRHPPFWPQTCYPGRRQDASWLQPCMRACILLACVDMKHTQMRTYLMKDDEGMMQYLTNSDEQVEIFDSK